MSDHDAMAGAPKTDENDPPAADGPVEESAGSPPIRLSEAADVAGRAANDPSMKERGLVPEALQCPPGKPDGEVDTGNRNRPPASLFS